VEGELGFQDDKSCPLPVTKPRRPHSGLLTSNLHLLVHRNNKEKEGGRKVSTCQSPNDCSGPGWSLVSS
jgi:hypothetical protein